MNLAIKERIVLITGGTGSLGQSLVSKLMKSGVKKIIIYSRNEYNQVQMERTFSKDKYPIRYFLGDVRDKDRLKRAFDNVNIVIHCAAIKHIDKAQYDPFEAVKTNTMGAQNVIDAAIDLNVDKVIAIGTDKAVNPCSLYGASKLCSDFMFVAANNYSPEKTRFSVIRFGNFWNSSGSIIEFLINLSRNKINEIPITDDRMTRFFISLEEAASRVIEAIEIMRGREIFTPKMESRKIIDIIKEMHPKSKLKYIGIRPGEKLHEELIINEYSQKTYETDRWFITYPNNHCARCIGEKVNEAFEFNSFIALKDFDFKLCDRYLNYKEGYLSSNSKASEEEIINQFKKTFGINNK